jgi:hypothetical protein
MAESGVTQTKMATLLGRSQAYVSERVNGLDAWNVNELSIIAPKLGYHDVFEMMRDMQIRIGGNQ